MRKPLFSIIIISGLLCFFSLRKGNSIENFRGDDLALYINQGQSLIKGTIQTCLEDNTFSMRNSSFAIGPDLYPWGFPVLLSPVIFLFGLNVVAMKLLIIFFWLLSIVVVSFLFKNKLPTSQPLLLSVIVLFAFNPGLIQFTDQILSDVPFLFFSLSGLLLIQLFYFDRKLLVNKWVS